MLKGVGHIMSFEVNGQYYMLADDIFSKWTIFVQIIDNLQAEKRQHYAKMQKTARKDLGCYFCVLQS